MLKDLQEKAKQYPNVLDWIDANADLIDTDILKFILSYDQELTHRESCFASEFLIDPDGLGFTKEEILGIIINDYKIGKWDGLDEWNKECATVGLCAQENTKWAVNTVRYHYNLFNRDNEILNKELVEAGVDYFSYLESSIVPKISASSYTPISHFIANCNEKDLYVAVQITPDMPDSWQKNGRNLPQMFKVFLPSTIRTVTSKNTLYFTTRSNEQQFSKSPFIMVSVNHMAKAGLDKAYPNVIIPKKIVDKYGLPVVDY